MNDELENKNSTTLRQKAEERLKLKINPVHSETDLLKLLHELQVHQIELEIQNEELVLSKKHEQLAKEKYAELYDFAPSGYLTLSKTGDIIDLNLCAAKMLDKKRLHLINNRFALFISENTRSIFNLFFQKVFTGKVKETCELTLSVQNKLPIHIFVTGIISENEQQCLVNVFDITERKKDEELIEQKNIEIQKAEESEQKYRLLAENISDVIWIFNITQNKFTYISPSVVHLTGFTVEEALSQKFEDVLEPEFVLKLIPELQISLKDFLQNPIKKPKYREMRHKYKNGGYIWIENNTHYQFAKNGELEIFGVSRNIEKRKQAEQDLKESEVKFSQAFHSNLNMAMITDYDDSKIVDVNQKFIDTFQLTKSDVIGKTSIELNIYDNATKEKIIDEFRSKGNITNFEIELNYNGEHIFGLISSNIFNLKNKRYLITIVQDITDRKKAELIINQQNDKLTELNATKDKFFRIIAHDLRGPIGTIDSFLDYILEEEKLNENADLLENLNILKTSSRQVFTLLENLLMWALVQNGEVLYKPSTHNIKEVIANNFEIFQLKAREKNIALINRVGVDTYCYFDYQMITAVIRNLLNNATKYTYENGTIEISLIEKEKAIEVTVKDSGVGMDKYTTDHVFHLDNKQLSKVGTKGEMGSGLGLILCKEFVEKNGGEIWAESEIGEGSEFKFTLPWKFEDIQKG